VPRPKPPPAATVLWLDAPRRIAPGSRLRVHGVMSDAAPHVLADWLP
jgi:hypothetical protein